MKKIFAFIFTIILLIIIIILVFLVQEQTRTVGKAVSPGKPSEENSYLFASPLLALANDQEKIRITVFILDDQGKGVPDKPVFLGQHKNLVIDPIQGTTDSLGKAIFDISSGVSAEYLIEVEVEGKVLPQKVKVSFR